LKKFFAVLSVGFFLFSLLMITSLSQNWDITFVEYLFQVSIFTPLFFNILGILCAFFSLKGATRNTLILINSLLMIYCGIFYLIALFDFQEL